MVTLEDLLRLSINNKKAKIFKQDGNLTRIGWIAYDNLYNIMQMIRQLGIADIKIEKAEKEIDNIISSY